VIVSGLPAPVAVLPPGLAVAVYDVIALPPGDTGGVKVTVACPTPAVAVPMVGGPGSAVGTTMLETVDIGPVPTAFVAVTLKV
jgi:hypothetical protein